MPLMIRKKYKMTQSLSKHKLAIKFLTMLSLLFVLGCGSKNDNESGGDTLKVCVSSTDVAELVKVVGGEHVSVTGFVKGQDDPHTVNTTPSMVMELSKADLVVVVGLGLEDAWLPAMLDQIDNVKIKPNGERHLDLSENMRTITGAEGRGVPQSFHPEDNPHYLADPIEGIKAAQAICTKLSKVQPDLASDFKRNADEFSKRVIAALVGEQLAEQVDASNIEALAIAIETNQYDSFPNLKDNPNLLGGWLGKLKPYTDTTACW